MLRTVVLMTTSGRGRRRKGQSMIDWEFAVQTAGKLVPPGPPLPREAIDEAVHELRTGAKVSEGYVRDFSGLTAGEATAPVLIVDRMGWVRANADGFSEVLQPLVDKVAEQRKPSSFITDSLVNAVGSRVTGAEAGALLGFLSTKVLGQFDPFWAQEPGTTGRMLLVAPNIVTAEQELDVDPHDFRLWVCLHEETHRVQFTAVPWLREHLLSEITAFVGETDVDPDHLKSMLVDALRSVGSLVRGGSGGSLVDLFTSPEQREIIARLTAVMSLLEGHADVVMDGVGPSVVPSVATIRKRFNRRRKGKGTLDSILRRLLGLEAKMRQYADGAVFVNAVVDRVGMSGFNAVWDSPATLPGPAEIADPAAWVRRVHG